MAVAPPLPAGGSGLPPAPYPPSSDAAAARSSDPLHSAEDGSPNVAGGTEQPSSSANNMLRMFGSQPANAAEAPTDATDALSKLAGLKTGSLWGKMKMAVGAAAKVKRASDLEVPDYDAALRKGTFRASFGTAERNIGDYIQTEAPAVHSYIEPTSTLKTNGIAWSKPHQPRARPQPSARKQGVAELLGIDPLASARPVLPEKGLSNSAPASLRASPLQTHSRPSPAAGLLPSLVHPSGCGSLPNTPPRRRAVVGMGWEAGRDADSEAAGKSASGYVRRSGVGWQAPSPPAGSGGGPSSSSRPRLGSGGELEQNVVMADTGPSAPPAPKLRGSNRERRTSHEMPPIDDAKQQVGCSVTCPRFFESARLWPAPARLTLTPTSPRAAAGSAANDRQVDSDTAHRRRAQSPDQARGRCARHARGAPRPAHRVSPRQKPPRRPSLPCRSPRAKARPATAHSRAVSPSRTPRLSVKVGRPAHTVASRSASSRSRSQLSSLRPCRLIDRAPS